MAASFDPYHTWLGIGPEEQPPDYYRLLGLRPFENGVAVIENAADQRMAHLRSFQMGRYAAASQKLLNEVATARVCLLSGTRKAAYDLQLRKQMDLASVSPGGDASPSAPPIPAAPRKCTPSRTTATSKVIALLGLVAVGLSLLLLVTVLGRRGQTLDDTAVLLFNWPAGQREGVVLDID